MKLYMRLLGKYQTKIKKEWMVGRLTVVVLISNLPSEHVCFINVMFVETELALGQS